MNNVVAMGSMTRWLHNGNESISKFWCTHLNSTKILYKESINIKIYVQALEHNITVHGYINIEVDTK